MARLQTAAPRLAGIEALRGIAATAVVACHAARHLDKSAPHPWLIAWFQPGRAGVDLFFVLSGFIILFVHSRDIGQPARLGHYLRRRLQRVVPLYWIALALTVAAVAAGHPMPGPDTLLWAGLLLPTLHEPLLGIAWTLQYEMVFYAVFACLIVDRRAGLVLLAFWVTWVAATAAGLGGQGIPLAVHGAYCAQFFLGMAAARWLNRRPPASPRRVAALGGVLFTAVLVLDGAGLLRAASTAAILAYGCSAAILVVGIAAWRPAVPAWLRKLGSASYSIYLFQFIFIGPTWKLLLRAGAPDWAPTPAIFLLLAGSAIAGGLAISTLIEQPLLTTLRTANETKVFASFFKKKPSFLP